MRRRVVPVLGEMPRVMLVEHTCLVAPHLVNELRELFGCLYLLEVAQDFLTDFCEDVQLFLHFGDGLVQAEHAHDALIEAVDGLRVEASQDFLRADVEETAG